MYPPGTVTWAVLSSLGSSATVTARAVAPSISWNALALTAPMVALNLTVMRASDEPDEVSGTLVALLAGKVLLAGTRKGSVPHAISEVSPPWSPPGQATFGSISPSTKPPLGGAQIGLRSLSMTESAMSSVHCELLGKPWVV